MAGYDKGGNPAGTLYNLAGQPLTAAYALDGTPIYPDGLTEYAVFEPTDAPSGYVAGSSSGKRGDVLNVSTSQFLALFYDGFLTSPPSGITVTKTSIGKDQSGTYDIYEYDFCPDDPSRLILLSSGMHSYELPASFGLANFIGNLYSERTASNEAFQYIRENVRVKVIPVVNPWGFNQNPKKYGDSLGVNPNRNFDYSGRWDDFPDYTPSQNEWNVKGSHPFSVAETINLAKWADTNWYADFWIDCHTDETSNAYDLDIYSLSGSAIKTPIANAIEKLKTWFASKYGSTAVVKHLLDSDGSIRQFWSEYVSGIPTMTLEQSPCRTTFGTAAQNESEDIANYCTNLSTFVQECLLSKYENKTIVPISSASSPTNVEIDVSDGKPRSRTIAAAVSPITTTQGRFAWTSSDDTICAVYGGTRAAVVVGLANGTATITGTNRFDDSIVVSYTVTVSGN